MRRRFVQYDYTEATTGNHSRLTKITYPDGYTLSYNYATGEDSNISRLTSISDASGTLEAYSYQGEGTVLQTDRTQPGLTLSKTLDDFGRVMDFDWQSEPGGVSPGSKVHFEYGYDANSNVLYKEDLVNSGLSELYTYDALNQLTGMGRGTLNGGKTAITGTPDFEQSWNLDAQGNWDDVTTNGVMDDRESNAQNEYTTIEPGGVSPRSLSYDANGNMTYNPGEPGGVSPRSYIWDAWNRLVEVQDSGNTTLVTYSYDSLNRRVTSDDDTTVTILYYSVGWQVLQEQVAGDVTQQYVYNPFYPDAIILRDRDMDNDGIVDERLWVIQDNNFNVMALVDDTGTVVERYKYTAFGIATIMDASYTVLGSSVCAWAHLHRGLRLEAVSGLYDNRFRWYSATLGQFVSNDPIGFDAGDVNVRRYVGNATPQNSDPFGLDNITPSYTTLSVTGGNNFVGAGPAITIDRHGEVYIGFTVFVGLQTEGFGAALEVGGIDCPQNAEALKSDLQDRSLDYNSHIAAGFHRGATYPPPGRDYKGIGIGTPSAGVNLNYSTSIGNLKDIVGRGGRGCFDVHAPPDWYVKWQWDEYYKEHPERPAARWTHDVEGVEIVPSNPSPIIIPPFHPTEGYYYDETDGVWRRL